jgi:hypothetical protein
MACVVERRGVHCAVIYEGRNPVTGRRQASVDPAMASLR